MLCVCVCTMLRVRQREGIGDGRGNVNYILRNTLGQSWEPGLTPQCNKDTGEFLGEAGFFDLGNHKKVSDSRNQIALFLVLGS